MMKKTTTHHFRILATGGLFGVMMILSCLARPALAGPSGVAGTALFEQFPMLYQGVAVEGMGGAFTAVANDENAPFYNPAGLDNIQNTTFAILNISGEVSYPTLYPNLYNSVQGLGSGNTSGYINAFNNVAGQTMYARVGDWSNYTTHDFSIGILSNNQMAAVANATPTTNNLASAAALSDTGIVVSGAMGFFNHHLQIGGTIMGLEQYFSICRPFPSPRSQAFQHSDKQSCQRVRHRGQPRRDLPL
jgi:hypothetical protein